MHFADSGSDDTHFVLDAVSGMVELGPAVRERDGSLTQHGSGSPRRARCCGCAAYRTGGGANGNITRGALSVLKAAIPYVGTGREPAAGARRSRPGGDRRRRVRGPMLLRTGSGAVTAEDDEHLARRPRPTSRACAAWPRARVPMREA